MNSLNLIDDYEPQLSKLDGAWAKILPMENLKGGAKNGYVINYKPHSSNNEKGIHSFITVARYWIFPDGVGIVIHDESLSKGIFKKIK